MRPLNVMRRRRADSIRTRTRLQGPSKIGYMRATDFSNCLQDKPSAEAGSIYAINWWIGGGPELIPVRLIAEDLGVLQIGGVEAFGEPAVNLSALCTLRRDGHVCRGVVQGWFVARNFREKLGLSAYQSEGTVSSMAATPTGRAKRCLSCAQSPA
jgi:hypothetical protein